jgi:L-malate glycosyltransferase
MACGAESTPEFSTGRIAPACGDGPGTTLASAAPSPLPEGDHYPMYVSRQHPDPSGVSRAVDRLPDAAVLIVTPWYRPLVGGVAEVAERLRSGLLRSGVDAHLLVLGDTNEITPDPAVPNVWRVAVHGSLFSSLAPRAAAATLLRAPRTLWQLARFVRARRISSVILLFPVEFAWAFFALHHLTGTRLIVSLHGSEVRGYPFYRAHLRWLLRRLLRAAAVVTVPSRELGEHVRAMLPDSRIGVVHLPNGVDTRHFTPRPDGVERDDPRPTALHISNFAPVKRTVELVEAFAVARLPRGSRLVFVGDGPERERTRRRALELGLGDRVEFVGVQTDVRPFLWQADVLVLPSERESSPLVLLEAMACGVPWIASPFGAAAEVPAEECGIVVPPGSPDRLAAALRRLLGDPVLRREMGARGRLRAERDYSLDLYIARHRALLAPEG